MSGCPAAGRTDPPPAYPFEPFDGRLSPRLAEIAASQPVMRVRLHGGRPVWLVTGYDEVRFVLTDRRLTRAIGSQLGALGPRGEAWQYRCLGMDGAPHAALRRLAARAFTARRVQAMLPAIESLTDELLDDLLRQGPPADLVSRLAFPLPMGIICRLLGVPEADRALFAAWSDVLMTTTGHTAAQVAAANDELTTYLRQRVRIARDPGQDLLTVWITARDNGDELAEEEILHLAVAVLVAGHETTANAIGNALWFLLEHPGEADRLQAEPAALPAAVEELLRLQQPSNVFRLQIATAPVEIGGIRIRPGEAVMALPFVANRDSRAFDDPHGFSPDRPGDHLAFGTGPHFCLGAALARAELRVVLGAVLTRMSGVRLAVPREAIRRKQDVMVTGLAELPVTWDPTEDTAKESRRG